MLCTTMTKRVKRVKSKQEYIDIFTLYCIIEILQ